MHPYSNQQYIILYQMNAESNMYNPWKIRMFLVVGGSSVAACSGAPLASSPGMCCRTPYNACPASIVPYGH